MYLSTKGEALQSQQDCQVIPSQPQAKKVLNTNKKTAAAIPGLLWPFEASGDSKDSHRNGHASSTDQHQTVRRPIFSMMKIGNQGCKEVLGSVASSQDTRRQTIHSNGVLIDCSSIVGDQVDTRDLLEHLVDVCQDDTMQVAVFIHGAANRAC